METPTRLKQTSAVAVYKVQFGAFSFRLKDLSQRHKDEIQLLVKIFNLVNMVAAFCLAKIQQEYIISSKKPWKLNVDPGDKKFSVLGVDSNNRVVKEVLPGKKISSAQMDEKRKKRLCYHCDDKWSHGHVCKKSKIYVLQEDDGNEVE